MGARRPLIGVIGGNGVPYPVSIAAERVGRAIATKGAVLLTGGQPSEGRDVKRAAMRGALCAERLSVGTVARLIGVLPLGETPLDGLNLRPKTQRLICTNLEGAGRNPINGMTPDKVLVFGGGSGTLAELGFALTSKTQVFFVNANAVAKLTGALDDENGNNRFLRKLDKGLTFLRTIQNQTLTKSEIEEMIIEEINKAEPVDAADDVDQWAETLVIDALQRVTAEDLSKPPYFPDSKLAGTYRKDFVDWYFAMP